MWALPGAASALGSQAEAQTVWREYERLWSEEQWVNRRSYAHLASVTGTSGWDSLTEGVLDVSLILYV